MSYLLPTPPYRHSVPTNHGAAAHHGGTSVPVNCTHTDAVAYSDAITGTDPVADSDSKTHTVACAYRVTAVYRRRGDTVPDSVGRVAHGRRQRRRARRQLWGHRQRRRHSHRPASTAHAGTHPTSANPITDAAIAEAVKTHGTYEAAAQALGCTRITVARGMASIKAAEDAAKAKEQKDG